MALKTGISIPTGYESLQRAAASKRKLAETMLAQGLAPDNNMQSWAQVLGKLGQTWAGKSMTKEADSMEADYATKLRGDYEGKLGQFYADAKTLQPQELVEKYQHEPLVVDALKPYAEAFASKLSDDQKVKIVNGLAMRQGDIKPGQVFNDPNASVWRDQDGQPVINGMGVAASMGRQGLGTEGQPMAMKDPTLAPDNRIDVSALNPEEQRILSGELRRRSQLSPEARNFSSGSSTTPPPSGVVAGKPYWLIQGKPYDNPEGK